MKSEEDHKICQEVEFIDKELKSSETVDVKQSEYQIGGAILSADIQKKENLRLFNGVVIEMLETDEWSIKSIKDVKIKKWKRIFSLMKKTLTTKLEYSANYNPQILKEIEPIDFPNLKDLNLFSAGIENYEAFTFMSMPFLEYLNIIYNNCPNFKSFNKLNLPSLKVLCIYIRSGHEDHEFSIQDFDRWEFNLTELRLEKSGFDAIMMQDLSKLAKSKETLNNVYYCREHRINQEMIRNKLTQEKNINFHFSEEAENNRHLHQFLNQFINLNDI